MLKIKRSGKICWHIYANLWVKILNINVEYIWNLKNWYFIAHQKGHWWYTQKESPPVGHIYPYMSFATRCQFWGGGSSSEHVWTGLQSWPPNVSSRGWARSQGSQCSMSERYLIVRCNWSWVMVTWDLLRTDTHMIENITFPQTSLAGSEI